MKDLNVADTWSNYSFSYVIDHLARLHRHQFSLYSSAYLDKDSYQDDFEPAEHELMDRRTPLNLYNGFVKTYI